MAASTYYNRDLGKNSDGTPIYANRADAENERLVIDAIQDAWKCEVRSFGKLCPIDFYALRDNRIVSVLELKSRTHKKADYPDVFLNVRKWLALSMASLGIGCPAIFVVKFTDGIYYVKVSEIQPGSVEMGGTSKIVKSRTDIEPVFRVGVQLLKELQNNNKETKP